MHIECFAILLRRLAAALANLVPLSDFLGAFQPEGGRVERHLRAPGAFGAKIAMHSFAANPVISALRRAKAAAVGLYQIAALWVFAFSQWPLLTLGHESSEFLAISLRNTESNKVLAQRFGVSAKLLGYVPDTHFLIPVKVVKEWFQFGIRRGVALGVPVALARTVLDPVLPVKCGIARFFEEDLAAVFTRLAWLWLLHLDTSSAENKASRFGHSAGVKRTDAKRDARELYRGLRRMLFDCALDRVKFSTSGLA